MGFADPLDSKGESMTTSDFQTRLASLLKVDVAALDSISGEDEAMETLIGAVETLVEQVGESGLSATDVSHIRQLLMSPEDGHQEQALVLLDGLQDEEAWTVVVQGCRVDEAGRFHSDELKLTHSVFRAFCQNPFADFRDVTALDLSDCDWLQMGDLACLQHLPLVRLDLSGNRATSADLSALGTLVNLTELSLNQTFADVSPLGGLVNLVVLDIRPAGTRHRWLRSACNEHSTTSPARTLRA